MRTIVALLFVSAALSAFATNPAFQFVEGLAVGINDTTLLNDLAALQISTQAIKADFHQVVLAAEAHDIKNATAALEVVIQDLYTVVVNTHDLISDIDNITQEVISSVDNLTKDEAVNNLLLNYNETKIDVESIRTAAENEDYYTIGVNAANLLKIAVFGRPNIPLYRPRSVRQLSETQVLGSVITDALDVILLIQGFLEHANTTVDATEFETFVNDATYAAVLVQPVVNDLKAKNFSAALQDGEAALNQVKVVVGDLHVLKGQIANWIARDLPLFEDHNRVVVAVETVFNNAQATELIVQSIEKAYENGDFEGTGEAIGDLYNEFYNALAQ